MSTEPGKRAASFGNLHAIRGAAALIVVFSHAKFALWVGGREFLKVFPLKGAVDYGLFSVDMLTSSAKQSVIIFFLLSAFVIKYSFHKNKLTIPMFYGIRAIRIYLPYLVSLIVSGLVLYLIMTYFSPDSFPGANREYNQRLHIAFGDLGIVSFLKALVFLPGQQEYFGFNPAYWSLLHEAIFYLLFPIYDKLKPKLLMGIVFLFGVAYFLTGSEIIYFQIFFLLGLLIFDFFVIREKCIAVHPTVFLIVLLLLFVAMNIAEQKFPGILPDGIAVLLYLWTINFLLQAPPVSWPLARLGGISYTLYLFHPPILMLCFAVFSRWVDGFSLYSRLYYYIGGLTCVALAYPIYVLIEKRSLSLIRLIKEKT